MKKTLLGFTIVLLLMISEILILNNDIASLKASNKILQEDLKDKKNISTLKEEKEDLNTSVSNLLAVSTFSDEDIEEIASDVFLVIWKNKEKLDINKEIAPYIAGITKKLILKRKNNIKNNNENIEEYENLLYEKNNDIHI